MFGRVTSEHRRLVILRMLNEHGGAVNAAILTDVCNAMGVQSTRDHVKGELTWLRDQGLVTVADGPIPETTLATATERGCDVAAGRATVPGVKRPTPKPLGI